MKKPEKPHQDFIEKITLIIQKNISDERFGVEDLASSINMSRSNLLRKVKALKGISVNQFIREERLKTGFELMKGSDLTVSEVSYRVGFSSPSYFIKCFHDHYGYTPGEAIKAGSDSVLHGSSVKGYKDHRLAAIMFTDIEGYTALMQKDEDKALEFINRHREVFNSITSKYGGRILQFYGDGTLSTFESAIDAVNCGIEMQMSFKLNPMIPVRIGIHSGDVIFSKDGVIGDGVNVASRIESLAIPGSVFVSEKVFDEIKNQSFIQTISLGKFEFKNVTKPIEVFAITNPGLTIPDINDLNGNIKKEDKGPTKKSTNFSSLLSTLKWAIIPFMAIVAGIFFYNQGWINSSPDDINTSKELSDKSIAVLPFINDSGDSSNIYIINGLMEAILNNLQKINDLRVISRTSTERYRGSGKSMPEIAKDLNVRYLVEGSGQKLGEHILLNVQLIDAVSDSHIWSQQFERETSDIFNIQIEVAKSIADEIQVIIRPDEALQ